jgi:hypothetical protein
MVFVKCLSSLVAIVEGEPLREGAGAGVKLQGRTCARRAAADVEAATEGDEIVIAQVLVNLLDGKELGDGAVAPVEVSR